jgi:AraC family transcriptional regulator, transcriptional activator of pobA
MFFGQNKHGMKTKMLHFNGLYGDDSKRMLPDFVHCESIETRSQKHDWKIKKHIHTALFQLFCIEKGAGKLLIEKQEIEFVGPCLMLIPENTLHGFDYSAAIKGTVLTISATFLEKLFVQNLPINLALRKLSTFSMANYESECGFILTIIEKIREELFDNLPERETMVEALFSTLLTAVYRLSSTNQTKYISQNQRSLSIFNAFVQTVKNSKRPQKLLIEYAQELKISSVHLNRICREVTQKTATQIVNDYFVSEAQKLLLHTSFGIAEIAYQLNFEDAAYFSRLFKKHTGKSPIAFRRG